MYDAIAKSHPSLERGKVKCKYCKRTTIVNSSGALAHGWPMCCGETMLLVKKYNKPAQKGDK